MSAIHASAEDYLESILVLHNQHGSVRSVDIARELGVSKPSVSVAMKNLRENGCVTVDDDGFIVLEPRGREIAERIYERHRVFTALLCSLGVSEDVAAADACRIEHVISDESFSAVKRRAEEAGLLDAE